MGVIERGKGWEMHLGDCREIMPRLGPVDHVVTDPPYSAWVHAQEKKAGTRRDGSRSLPAINFASLTPAAMEEAGAAIAASTRRWAVVFSDAESNAAWRRALEPLRHIRVGVWAKPDASPQFSGDRPSASFELTEAVDVPVRHLVTHAEKTEAAGRKLRAELGRRVRE